MVSWREIVFPQPNDAPPHHRQCLGHDSITAPVRPKLFAPEFDIAFWQSRVPWKRAIMPKASVDEDNNALQPKNEVRVPEQTLPPPPARNSIHA
jgi:hypothetical protein